MRKLLAAFPFFFVRVRSHTICRLQNGCFSPAHLICQSLFYLFSCRALCICLNHAITPLSLYLYVRIINSQNPTAAAQPLACIANSGVLACYLPLASSTPCPWGNLNRINLAGRELIKAEILCCFLFFFATLQRTWGFNGVLPAACWS